MFEKEAQNYALDEVKHKQEWYIKHPEHSIDCDYEDIKKHWSKGAEFGYNKANEWHYMKDVNCYEDLHFPPEGEEKDRLLIWKVQVITEKGIKQPVCYHCGSYGDLWYEINAYHVIAWKEIVLPKESE